MYCNDASLRIVTKPLYRTTPPFSVLIELTYLLIDFPLVKAEFVNWENLEYTSGVWLKVGNLPLALLRKVLNPHPSRRATIPQIKVTENQRGFF
jgi:hypothetical protein